MVAAGGVIDPELGDELVKLHEEEGLESYLGHAYTRAALLHSLVADEPAAVDAGEAVDDVSLGHSWQVTSGGRPVASTGEPPALRRGPSGGYAT